MESMRARTLVRSLRSFVITLVLVWGVGGEAQTAESISIAAASDLVFCMVELNADFNTHHPAVEVKLSTGSSGNFFAQIQRGAPFDVFLSADMRYPSELVKTGHAEARSLMPYAVGRIVLWTVKTNVAVTNGLTVLTSAVVKRFAVANPDHAPYGRAARAALDSSRLWSGLQPKLVTGENVAQAAQFVETGNVDAGIVALSVVSAPKLKNVGVWWLIPEELHAPMHQAAVLTRRGASNVWAQRYMEFLRTRRAREIFERFGFRLPAH